MLGMLQQAATLDIASPDSLPVPETTIWAIVKPPLLESALSMLTKVLETNSTVVWQSARGISLILPDIRFGSVFQY